MVPSRFVPNVVTDFGIVILDKSQLVKHILPSFVTVSGITFISQRFDTDQPYEIAGDGRVDYGLTLLYRFNTIV